MDIEPSQVNVDLKVDNTEYDYWCPSIDNFDFHIKVQLDQVCCGHGRPCAALKAQKCIGFGACRFFEILKL